MVQLVASLTINLDEPEALAKYLETTTPLIEKVGAKVVQQIELGTPVVGETPYKLLMMVEYPSHAAVEAVFDSDEYKSIIPIRERAFTDYNICIVKQGGLVDSFVLD